MLTVVLSGGDTLLGLVTLLGDDGSGGLVGIQDVVAPGHGRDAVLQMVRIETTGTYVVRVRAERSSR